MDQLPQLTTNGYVGVLLILAAFFFRYFFGYISQFLFFSWFIRWVTKQPKENTKSQKLLLSLLAPSILFEWGFYSVGFLLVVFGEALPLPYALGALLLISGCSLFLAVRQLKKGTW